MKGLNKHSIKTKIMLMTTCAILVVILASTFSGILVIRNVSNSSARQMLMLMCESGQRNLDHYFESVEQSVEMVSAYVESDLDGIDDARLQAHLGRVDDIFKKLTYKTFGVLTYYYRIDPSVSTTEKGFWYVNLDGDGFKAHEVTDITLYDTENTDTLVWFTVPKATGKPIWLPPYITDNLDVRVISYNVPVYFEGRFIGVIGIEIDYSSMARQVDNITLYENGYAFINDQDGKIVYHPRIDVTTMKEQPKVPDGLISDSEMIRYEYDGVEKNAVWRPLSNGMRLNVTVPTKEVNALWFHWSIWIVIAFALLLLIFVFLITHFSEHITRPLRNLTEAAEQVDDGNYDYQLEYDGKDEVGILTRTFKKLVSHLKTYISDLNDLAYADALTSVHNKGAFDLYMKNLQTSVESDDPKPQFAVCIFDCNGLKVVNDQNGHDKGDIYLKAASKTICEVFRRSPVFRIGGDEFAAVLLNHDFENRETLVQTFNEACAKKSEAAMEIWEQVDIAFGMAVYDPNEDLMVDDVVRRADKLMYENKWQIKNRK